MFKAALIKYWEKENDVTVMNGKDWGEKFKVKNLEEAQLDIEINFEEKRQWTHVPKFFSILQKFSSVKSTFWDLLLFNDNDKILLDFMDPGKKSFAGKIVCRLKAASSGS